MSDKGGGSGVGYGERGGALANTGLVDRIPCAGRSKWLHMLISHPTLGDSLGFKLRNTNKQTETEAPNRFFMKEQGFSSFQIFLLLFILSFKAFYNIMPQLFIPSFKAFYNTMPQLFILSFKAFYNIIPQLFILSFKAFYNIMPQLFILSFKAFCNIMPQLSITCLLISTLRCQAKQKGERVALTWCHRV